MLLLSHPLQELCIGVLPNFAELLDFASLNKSIVSRLLSLLTSTTSLSVSIPSLALICIQVQQHSRTDCVSGAIWHVLCITLVWRCRVDLYVVVVYVYVVQRARPSLAPHTVKEGLGN